MKKVLALTAVLMGSTTALANEVVLKECRTELFEEVFHLGECGHGRASVPCSSTRVKIGEVQFDLRLDTEGGLGSGHATATDQRGVKKSSSLNCQADQTDPTWISCQSERALLGKNQLSIDTNRNGIGAAEFFLAVFVGRANSPSGSVTSGMDCSK